MHVPDLHKSQQMCEKVLLKSFEKLQFILDCFKT